MEWFKHYFTASADKKLIALERDYGLAGLGFYWKVREKIGHNNGQLPLSEVVRWYTRGLKHGDKLKILADDSLNLFTIDADANIRLACAYPHADPGADAGANAGVPAGAGASVPAGSSSSSTRKDKKRKDNTIKKTLSMDELFESAQTNEEKEFYEKMLENYPRVCQLPQPLSYAQLNRLLVKGITAQQIADTLSEMENYALLHDKCVSANLTIQNWIRRRRQ